MLQFRLFRIQPRICLVWYGTGTSTNLVAKRFGGIEKLVMPKSVDDIALNSAAHSSAANLSALSLQLGAPAAGHPHLGYTKDQNYKD